MALRTIGLIYSHFFCTIISRFWVELSVIISKDKYSPLVVIINEDVAAVSLISLYGDDIEDSEKQYIVTNI